MSLESEGPAWAGLPRGFWWSPTIGNHCSKCLLATLPLCRYYPSGDAFASGSDDATVCLSPQELFLFEGEIC